MKRVRALCDFDLAAIYNKDAVAIAKIEHDPVLLGDIIYSLCKPEADKAGMTDEQFGELLANGDIIANATEAMLKALADFSRSPVRKMLNRAIETSKKLEAENDRKLEEAMNQPDFNEKMEEAMQTVYGQQSGDVLES
jgi:hypothetical protein